MLNRQERMLQNENQRYTDRIIYCRRHVSCRQRYWHQIYYRGSNSRSAIFNIFGKKIYEGKFKISIKTDGLFSGVYRVELYNNRGKEEKILIVN